MRGPYLYSDRFDSNAASKQFVKHPACKLSPGTLRVYRQKWARFQTRYPDVRFNEFTEKHVLDFLFTEPCPRCKDHGWTRDDPAGKRSKCDDHRAGPARKPGQPGYREGTAHQALGALRCIFHWGVRVHLLEKDPTIDVLDYLPKVRNHKRHTWLKMPDVERLMCSFDGEDPISLRNRTVVQFLLGSGVRRMEAVAFRWEHFDLNNKVAMLHVPDGKGNKPREVALTPKTIIALRTWREIAGRDEGIVFPRLVHNVSTRKVTLDWNTGIAQQGVHDIVHKAGVAAGIPNLAPHDLRRSHAGLLDDLGWPVQDISRQLGHSDLSTTMRYLQDNPTRRTDGMGGSTF